MTPLYIFDLDGTLALIEHRRHLVDGRCQDCSGDGGSPTWENTDDGGMHTAGKNVCGTCGGTGERAKDWPAFFAACKHDQPNWPVISAMHALLKSGADVQIWSGRSAVVMNETLAWLQCFVFGDGSVDPEEVGLMMRREGDFTPDEQLKASWLDDLSEFDRRRLVAVFDDRKKVVDMWRSKGVACFQVAPGEF